MSFVSRAEWGAAPPRGSTTIPGPVLGVTCHWEGPTMGWPWRHTDCPRKVRAIQRYHQGTKGWSDIAYNALACPHGDVFEGRGPGRRSAANGESDIGGNDRWYALCYLAGIGDEFTAAGQAAMLQAIAWLRSEGRAGLAVNGHRDHHPTECPGEVIYAWVRSGIPPAREPVLEVDEMKLSDKLGSGEDAATVGSVLKRLDRFMANSTEREKRMLRVLQGVGDEIAAAVVAELRSDVQAGGGISLEQVRRVVFTQATRALNTRLGSLDEK